MCRFSSKSSLLAGVSAVVLAASVGSGAFAQTAVDYTKVGETSALRINFDIWADGTARTNTSSTNMANAKAGDNLTIGGGTVAVNHTTRRPDIGILKSGSGRPVGNEAVPFRRLVVGGGSGSSSDVSLRVGEIIKTPGSEAIWVEVGSNGSASSSIDVTRDAHIRKSDLDMTSATGAGKFAKALFNGDLVVDQTTALKSGNNTANPVNVFLELKGDATFGGNVTLDDQGANGRAYITISGDDDQTIGRLNNGTAQITAAADGEGTIQVLNGVNNAAPHKATFDIEIGHDAATDANDKRLKQLTVGQRNKGGHAIFNRAVHVDNIDVLAGENNGNSNNVEHAMAEFRGDVSGDTIMLRDGEGNGSISRAQAVFNAMNGDITIDAGIVGYQVSEGRVTIIGGRSGNRQHKVTFNKEIGAGGDSLSGILVGRDGSAGVAVFKEDTSAGFIKIGGGATAGAASHMTIEKSLRRQGSIDIGNNATLTIGGAGRSATVNDTGQAIRGWIEAGGDGQGTLIVDNRGNGTTNANNNTVTFSSSVGLDGEALRQITLSDGRTTFSSGVYARSITIDTGDATTFKGDVKVGTGIQLGRTSGFVTFGGAADQRILGTGTAKITTAADGEGTIQVLNGVNNAAPNKATFDIEIGATDKRLGQLTVGDTSNGGHAIFNRGVHVDNIDVIGGNHTNERTTVEFRGDVSGETIALKDGFHRTSPSAGTVVNARAIFNASASDITVGNKITGGRSDGGSRGGGLTIIGGRSGDPARRNTVTFNGEIGAGRDRIGRIFVGNNESAGVAVFKKDINAGSIEIRGGATADAASHVTIEQSTAYESGFITIGNNATLTIGGVGRLATVNDGGQTIRGFISAGSDGQGTLIVDNRGDGTTNVNNNKVTFTQRVGYDGTALEQIILGDGRTTFNKGVYADRITITTSDATVFKGDVKAETGFRLGNGSSVTFGDAAGADAAGQTITGNITSAAGGDYGAIIIANSHADGVTFKGSLGASGANNGLSRVTLNNNVKAAFAGNVYLENGLTFGNGSQVTFNGTDSQTIAGDLTSAAGGNYGTIIIANTHADGVSFKGSLGASGANNGLSRVTLNNNVKAAFAGNVYLGNGLTFGNGSQVTFNGTGSQTVAGNITSASGGNYGTITIDNDDGVTFKGALGASGTNNGLNSLTLNDDSEATFEGHVYLANGLTLGNSTITFRRSGNQTVQADITNSTGKRGSVVVNNSGTTNNNIVTFEGAVGASGNDLAGLSVRNGVARFKGDVFAGALLVESTDGAEFRGNVTTGALGISFAGNDAAKITLNGTANQTVTGDITTDSDGRGLLVVNNAHATTNKVTFGGSVGADGTALKQITLSAGRTTFHSGVYADTINITTTDATVFKGDVKAETRFRLGNGSSVTFNGTTGQTVTGDITRAAGGDYGTIIVANTHADGVTFAGQLGASGQKLNRVTLNDDSNATFAGSVYLANGLKLGDDATITFGGSGNQTIKAVISNSTGKRGSVVVNNSGTTNRTVSFEDAVGAPGNGNDLARLTLDNGQTVFAGAVYAGTIDVNADSDGTTFNSSVTTRAGLTLAGAATFKGSVTTGANGLVFDGAGGAATFAGTGAQTITPAITTDANNQGAITIANRAGVTFEGNLGATTARLARLTLHTDTKATLEQSGYFAGNVTIGNRATLIVGDASGVTGTNGRGTGATDAQTITGDIVAGDDGQGNLEIRNRSSHATGRKVSFTGSIGTAEDALNRITVADGETTFNGDVYAGNLNITASDATTFKGNVKAGTQFELGDGSSVTFGGTAGQTITGDITGASGGDYGAIIIANTDGVTFEGALGASGGNNGLRSLTVNEDAKVTFNRPVYLSGDLTAHRNSTLTLGPAFGQREGDAADQAFITVGGDFNLGTADADNSVRIAFDSSFTEGEQKLINKDLRAVIDSGKLILVESNVLKYELATDDGGSVIAWAKGFKSAGEVSSKLGVSPSEASVLLAASSLAKDLPANDPVKKILEEATRAGNEAKGKRLAAQLTPQMTALGGVRRAVVSTGTQVAGVVGERLSVQRGGDSQSGFVQSGFATGGEGLDRAFWLKPFGSRGKQAKDKKQRIDGYDTSARGLAVGVDAPVGERGRVGTALAYSTSRMTGKGVGEDKTDVRSWQVSIYGDYSTGRYYVDGQVGVGRNDVSTTSRVAGLRRKSAYDTTSLTASVGGGVPLRLDASTTLTPTAGLSWTRVGSAKYTTTGALSLNQKITVGSIDAVVGTLGTRLHKEITRGNGTLVPVVRVGLSYDFAGDQTTARGRFTGGGSRFTVKGAKVRKLSGTAGVGLSYNAPRWSIGADYDLIPIFRRFDLFVLAFVVIV